MNSIHKVIPIGTEVEVENVFTGKVASVTLSRNRVTYEVYSVTKEGAISIIADDYEITSDHKEYSIIKECLKGSNDE